MTTAECAACSVAQLRQQGSKQQGSKHQRVCSYLSHTASHVSHIFAATCLTIPPRLTATRKWGSGAMGCPASWQRM